MIMLYILAVLAALILGYVLFLCVCALAVDPKREYGQHSRFYRRVLNGATALGMKVVGVRIHTEGLELIPRDTKKLLFVSNHRSNFDPLVTWLVLKKWDVAFLSKASNFKIPIFGRLIRKCCFMAIDREDPRKAMTTILKAADLLEKGQVSVGVYPEGTRSKSGQLLDFHSGVLKIAQKAHAPVVVLTVEGTEKIHKNYLRRRTDVHVKVVQVLDADTVAQTRTTALGAQIHQTMEQRLGV